LHHASLAAFCDGHDHRNTFRGFDSGGSLKKFKAVHYGHIDVASDEVERAFLNPGKGFGAVACFKNFGDVPP
jgi:hypothetical protein